MLPSRKRTQGGASLCPGLSHFAPLGRTDRSTRKSSVITQQATEVLRLQLRPRCKQERRDNADTAVMQPARLRVTAELRKQIANQKSHVCRGVYPWVPWALQTELPRHDRNASVAYRLAPTCWPRRATNRSIHLEPLSERGYTSKPEPQQIYPRCLYAYAKPRVKTIRWAPRYGVALMSKHGNLRCCMQSEKTTRSPSSVPMHRIGQQH